MTKIFKVPFADTGDKISPPDAVQADGSVSYTLGYGFDYQRDTSLDSGGAPVDPLAKVFPREQHNGILNDITTALGEVQANGFTLWQSAGSPYPVSAIVRHEGINWKSVVSNNTAAPGSSSANWVELGYQPNSTEAVFGLIRIATQAETDAGGNDSSAVTPKKLAAKIKQATEDSLGILKISTYAQAIAGADNTTAMTPARVKAVTPVQATESNLGISAIASQGDMAAQVNDSRFVTPQKLTSWFNTKLATYADKGITSFATSGEVITGEAESKSVSPATIRFGFQVLKSTTGYIKFPSWLGGLIVQWTKTPVLGISVPYTWTYPIQFPNMVSGTFGMFIGLSQGTLEVTETPSLNNSKFANGLAGSTAGPAFVFAWGF